MRNRRQICLRGALVHAGEGAAQLKPLKPNIKQRSCQASNSITLQALCRSVLCCICCTAVVWCREHMEAVSGAALGHRAKAADQAGQRSRARQRMFTYRTSCGTSKYGTVRYPRVPDLPRHGPRGEQNKYVDITDIYEDTAAKSWTSQKLKLNRYRYCTGTVPHRTPPLYSTRTVGSTVLVGKGLDPNPSLTPSLGCPAESGHMRPPPTPPHLSPQFYSGLAY